MSPDGTRAAYVHGVSDYDSGAILTVVKEKNLETGEEWTPSLYGMQQKEACYCPDGTKLAFLASDGRPWQLWVKDCISGRLNQITHCRYGVTAPCWSGDGSKLAFEINYFPKQTWETELCPENDGILKNNETEEELLHCEMTAEEYSSFLQKIKEQPKVFDNLIYKLDSDYGMRDGSRTAIAVCDLSNDSIYLVTPLDKPYQVPSFLRNDKKIVCYGYPYTHCKELNSELYLIDLDTGEQTMVEKTIPSYYSFPVTEDTDGSLIYCGVHVCGESVLPELYSVSETQKESRLLFDTWPVCHGLDPIYSGDAHLGQKDCPFFMDKEGNIFFVSYSMGRSNIFCWNGKTVYAVTEEDCVLSFSASQNGKFLVLRSEWNQPAFLSVTELRKTEDGLYKAVEQQRLAEENKWLQEYTLIKPQPLSAQTKDGKAIIYGWAVIPEESSEPASIAAVLDVHGGPEACYVNGFFYEVQMMAARGMAVLFCDPRGSAGYGPEFMSGSYAYGQEAVDDYQVFLEEALKKYPQIDPKRIGITGGSYGGHMTNKMISVTDLFAAAVTQRTWVNPSSSYGTGDMGFFSAGASEASFLDYMKNRVRKSIMKYIRNIHIPVLVLHGEQDYRCALEQGEQVYHALRSLHPELPVKIVIFPEENHGVTREGKMHNQIRHMKEMTEWFEKYLGGPEHEI